MASTNKTTNYDLSQYVGSDKPSYLNDYNQDMSRIDLGIHAAKSEADDNATSIGDLTNLTTTAKTDLVSALNEVDSEAGTANATAVQADGKADTNATAIGTLANLDTTTKSNLVSATNEVNGKIGTLSNLDTTEKSSVVGAINEVNYNLELLNLTSFTDYGVSDASVTNGTLSALNITLATNNTNSIFKLYGNIAVVRTGSAGSGTVTISTPLRPENNITINGSGFLHSNNGSSISRVIPLGSFTVKTNGDIEIPWWTFSDDNNANVLLFACLYFLKDFGDTPIPQN